MGPVRSVAGVNEFDDLALRDAETTVRFRQRVSRRAPSMITQWCSSGGGLRASSFVERKTQQTRLCLADFLLRLARVGFDKADEPGPRSHP